MRFSVAATAVLAGAANASLEAGGQVSQIPDGQVQAPGPDSPAASLPPVITTSAPAASPETTAEGDSTIYQTVEVTITSCGPSTKSCPATTSPYVTTSVIAVPSGNPALVPTTPAEVPTSAPVEVPSSAPAVPVSSTLGSSPVDQTSEHAAPPAGTTPAPEVPSSTLGSSPVGASSICECPAPVTECPAPVTIYSTVTVSPSGVPTGAAPGSPVGSTPGAPGSPEVSAPGVPGSSPVGSTPGAPGSPEVSAPGAPGSSPVGSIPGAPGSSPVGSTPVAPGVSSPSSAAPIAVPGAPGNSPVGATPAAPFPVEGTGVPGPVGAAPIGTASTGG
ncbi:MAG: hypothetical protein Q9184_007836, partial [Pyrenodesmia sp. 2 TL-2023]